MIHYEENTNKLNTEIKTKSTTCSYLQTLKTLKKSMSNDFAMGYNTK